ncbi:MAG TPA: methyltransferase domain-containing protein [Terriglobia bacterium]|nr:methyltransferase domain-containing protein [Terriglobia bacterium]
MSKTHTSAVQKQFTSTAEAFSKHAVRDTLEVLAEKVEFARPQAGDAALDVACGPGAFVLALAARVRFARGIDLTEAMLRQAREFQRVRGISNVSFDQGEAEQLPYPDGALDLVSCQCSLHHVAKPERVLEEMIRVLKPEGRLVIIDTLGPESDAKFELHNRIETVRDPSHTSSLRWTTFRSMFEQQGLRIVDEKVRRRQRSFNQWMLRAGLQPDAKRYQEARKLLEDSIPKDGAGFSPQPQGDDFLIVHNEGMFLLTRIEAPTSHAQ